MRNLTPTQQLSVVRDVRGVAPVFDVRQPAARRDGRGWGALVARALGTPRLPAAALRGSAAIRRHPERQAPGGTPA